LEIILKSNLTPANDSFGLPICDRALKSGSFGESATGIGYTLIDTCGVFYCPTSTIPGNEDRL
jgi:hypothetical protein